MKNGYDLFWKKRSLAAVLALTLAAGTMSGCGASKDMGGMSNSTDTTESTAESTSAGDAEGAASADGAYAADESWPAEEPWDYAYAEETKEPDWYDDQDDMKSD